MRYIHAWRVKTGCNLHGSTNHVSIEQFKMTSTCKIKKEFHPYSNRNSMSI